MISRYPKILIMVDVVNIRKVNQSVTYTDAFQDNKNQVNRRCRLQRRIQNIINI